MNRPRSLRVLVEALAPIAVLLTFASGAAAETWSGEATTIEVQEGHPVPEVTLVTASASYDPTAGNVSVDIVTGAEPPSNLGEEPNQGLAAAGLLRVPGACNYGTISGYIKGGAPLGTSTFVLDSPYSQPFFGFGILDRQPELVEVPVTKAVSGSATTLSAGSSLLANQRYNCAYVTAVNATGSTGMVFPLVLQPSAPPEPAAPAPPAPAAPAPAPPALSIAKAKPFKLKAGKTTAVKIKVTNTGATTSAQGSLRVKPTKGILVTPEQQKLPPLAPGASWTVWVRLKPTERAKAKSTLPLTAAASGITGKGSLAVKVEQ
jgi:hypothetical protein